MRRASLELGEGNYGAGAQLGVFMAEQFRDQGLDGPRMADSSKGLGGVTRHVPVRAAQRPEVPPRPDPLPAKLIDPALEVAQHGSFEVTSTGNQPRLFEFALKFSF